MSDITVTEIIKGILSVHLIILLLHTNLSVVNHILKVSPKPKECNYLFRGSSLPAKEIRLVGLTRHAINDG